MKVSMEQLKTNESTLVVFAEKIMNNILTKVNIFT